MSLWCFNYVPLHYEHHQSHTQLRSLFNWVIDQFPPYIWFESRRVNRSCLECRLHADLAKLVFIQVEILSTKFITKTWQLIQSVESSTMVVCFSLGSSTHSDDTSSSHWLPIQLYRPPYPVWVDGWWLYMKMHPPLDYFL